MFLQRCSSEQQQQRQPGLRWTVDGQFFSFYFTGPNAARDRELAEVTLLNCIFESEYRRPHSEAKREELTQFISNEQQQQPATPTKSAASTTITPNSPPLTAKLTSPQTIASPPPSSSSWSTSTSSSKLSLPKFSVETPLAGKLVCIIDVVQKLAGNKQLVRVCSDAPMLRICFCSTLQRTTMCRCTVTSQCNFERSRFCCSYSFCCTLSLP